MRPRNTYRNPWQLRGLLASGFIVTAALVWGGSTEIHHLLKIYPAKHSNAPSSRQSFIDSEKVDKSVVKNLNLAAKIELKTEKITAVGDSVDLTSRISNVTDTHLEIEDLGVEPISSESLVSRTYDILFETSSASKPYDLNQYDEMWVDYNDLNSQSATLCFVLHGEALDPLGNKGAQRFRAVAGNGLFNTYPVQSFDVTHAHWVEKDPFYILGRICGVVPDGSWVYKVVDRVNVLQHRMHADLTNVDFIDFVLEDGTLIDGVDLRITDNDNNFPGKYIELADSHITFHNDYGDLVCRIKIKNVMKREFRHAEKTFLQEIVFRTRVSDIPVAIHPPLKTVLFERLSGLSAKLGAEQDEDVMLPFRIEPTSSGWRMVIDLGELKARGKIPFSTDSISIAPNDNALNFGIKIDKIQLVSLLQTNRPVFLNFGSEFLQRWGAYEVNRSGTLDKVQWPNIVGYFPFRALEPQLPAMRSGNVVVLKNDVGFILAEKPENLKVQDRGLEISSEHSIIRSTPNEQGVTLEGFGDWINLRIPMPGVVPDNSSFFIGLSTGEDHIEEMTLTVPFENAPALRLKIRPNSPIFIPASGKIKNVEVNLKFTEPHFVVGFREAALFSSKPITVEEAFSQQLPSEVIEKPQPMLESTPGVRGQSAAGFIRGTVDGRTTPIYSIRWRTTFEQAFDWPKVIRLSYDFSSKAAFNKRSINLTLNWDGGSVRKKVDLDETKNIATLSMSDLMSSEKRYFGRLKSIDWDVLSESPFNGTSFRFLLSVSGLKMESVREQLEKWPVLYSNGVPLKFFPQINGDRDFFNYGVWALGSPESLLTVCLNGAQNLVVDEDPWFKLTAAFIGLNPNGDLAVWNKIVTAPAEPKDSPIRNKIKLVLKLILIMGLLRLLYQIKTAMFSNPTIVSCLSRTRQRFCSPFVRGNQIRTGRVLLFAIILLAMTTGFYFVGLSSEVPSLTTIFCFVGNLIGVVALALIVYSMEPIWRTRFPKMAAMVFADQSGSAFFATAVLAVVMTALINSKWPLIANQTAHMILLALTVGGVIELRMLIRPQRPYQGKENSQ